jgi:hypothetical protein
MCIKKLKRGVLCNPQNPPAYGNPQNPPAYGPGVYKMFDKERTIYDITYTL